MSNYYQSFRNRIPRNVSMLLAFVLLAAGGYLGIKQSTNASIRNTAQTLYKSQVEACERGNKLRRESNDRVNDHLAERDVVSSFLLMAAEARERAGTKLDIATAKRYRILAHRLRTTVFYTKIPVPSCESIIKKP